MNRCYKIRFILFHSLRTNKFQAESPLIRDSVPICGRLTQGQVASNFLNRFPLHFDRFKPYSNRRAADKQVIDCTRKTFPTLLYITKGKTISVDKSTHNLALRFKLKFKICQETRIKGNRRIENTITQRLRWIICTVQNRYNLNHSKNCIFHLYIQDFNKYMVFWNCLSKRLILYKYCVKWIDKHIYV